MHGTTNSKIKFVCPKIYGLSRTRVGQSKSLEVCDSTSNIMSSFAKEDFNVQPEFGSHRGVQTH
jgi:hypothetical protein